MPLTFLHLSDLHFRAGLSDTAFDLDREQRAALCEDLPGVLGRLLDGRELDGILLSGDIAFAGTASEYEIATAWLETLCETAGCAPERVWMVPGNHDVDRRALGGSVLLRMLQRELRTARGSNLDGVIKQILTDAESQRIVYLPLADYNAFAARYQCEVNATQPFWQQRFVLDDGSPLIIRGVNSVLVSDGSDDTGANKLVLGSAAALFNDADATYLFMCHHPPHWLVDEQELGDRLDRFAKVQLFGHDHRQRLRRFGNAVRVHAGALQPDRQEGQWRPQYNVLMLDTTSSGASRTLRVQVHPRSWSDQYRRFTAELTPSADNAYTEVLALDPRRVVYVPRADVVAHAVDTIGAVGATGAAGAVAHGADGAAGVQHPAPTDGGDRLPPMRRPDLDHASTSAATEQAFDAAPASAQTRVAAEGAVDAMRRLTYRFMGLPHVRRLLIAQALELTRDEDEGVRDDVLWRRMVDRARTANQLDRLWDAVEAQRGAQDPDLANPFR